MAINSRDGSSPQFFDALARCETRLYNAVGEALRAEHGMTTVQFEFLGYLRDHPQTRVADVATAFAAGIGSISKLMDRLETRGWAERLPNAADGRSSLLRLTATGARLVVAAEQTFNQRLDELVHAALDTDELAAVTRALTVLRASLEHARAGVPTG